MSTLLMNEEWNTAIASLYEDKDLLKKTADVRIVVGEKTFLAHRWILAAQSPVLLTRFANDKKMAVINIENPDKFTAQAVEAVIRYCYNGYVDNTGPELTKAIIKAAQDFGMSDLEEDMKTRLPSKCPPGEVTTKCTAYMAVNKSVAGAAKWMLDIKRPELAEELLKGDQWVKMADRSLEGKVARRNRNIFLLCNYDKTADCWIQAGNERFPAHRCILMAHSLHFREMFTNPAAVEFDTGVAREKTIPEAVLDVLIYCYFGGFISQERKLADPMFQLADKYSMTGMKSRLERRFIAELNSVNVLKMAMLADVHSADELKQACIEFMAKDESVEKSAEWKKLQKESGLAAELSIGVVKILRKEKTVKS